MFSKTHRTNSTIKSLKEAIPQLERLADELKKIAKEIENASNKHSKQNDNSSR